MKLITFQSYEALESLMSNKYLACDEEFIDMAKMGTAYEWIAERMREKIQCDCDSKYPIWAWVKCYNGICPPKHKGTKVGGFDVKITFKKGEKDVLVTDFRRYSFVLNNMYIPDSIQDKKKFDSLLEEKNITKEELRAYVRHDKYAEHRTDREFLDICKKIRESCDKCITVESNILQGCVWKISLDEVEKIEILHDNGYTYGSLNYKRCDGRRMNWMEDFYRKL